MKTRITYLLFAALLALSAQVSAQSSFTATVDKNPVAMGDRFKLMLTIQNAKGDITPPKFNDFNLIFGPAKSTSYQFINGETSSSIVLTYTLAPKSVGTFTIGEAAAHTDAGTLYTDPIRIKVVESQSGSQSGAQSGNNRSRNVQGNDELMAEIRLDKRKVYKGEQVVATYYIYSRFNNIDFTDYKFPATNGFYSHDFDEEQAGWLNNLEVINGKQYRVAILKKQILFPTQHGTIELDPMTVTARVDYSFFNPGRTLRVNSNAIKLEVMPLPSSPGGFKGDVGKFNFDVKIDAREVQANDAITLTAKISGSGNLKLVNAPEINFPSDFEVYDPKVTNRFSTASGSLSGSREFEYLIIPRHAGNYTIPPITYTYFDPVTGTYKTTKSEAFDIVVNRSNGQGGHASYSGSQKEDVVILDQDIRFIKPAEKLRPKSDSFFGSLTFYALFFLSPILLLVFYVVRRKYIRERQDASRMRSKRAGRMANKLLSQANAKMKANDREGFYDAVFKAMYGFLGGKLNISPAVLSREQIREGLESRSIDEDTINELMELLSRCEIARFAPSGDIQPKTDYDAAASLINNLQKRL